MKNNNKKYCFAFVLGGAILMFAFPSNALVSITCRTSETCRNIANATFPCCCPTGETGTSYSCPTGWARQVNVSDPDDAGTCTRRATTGSDIKGTYTQEYGTCAPTASTYNCYEAVRREDQGQGGRSCFCTAIN